MPGLMQWRSPDSTDSTKTLYVNDGNGWLHYSRSALRVTDYDGQHSKGMATAQRLLRLGFEYLPSDVVELPKMMPPSCLSEEQRQRWSA